MKKNTLIINRTPPHGSIYAQESLDVALMGAAFDQSISLAFIDDGVYQLLRDQAPKSIGRKHFAAAFRALDDYGIQHLYVEADSLQKRGLKRDDLIDIRWIDATDNDTEKPSITLLDQDALRDLIDKQDTVLSF